MNTQNKNGQPKLADRRQVSAGCESALYASVAAWWARLTDGCRQRLYNITLALGLQGPLVAVNEARESCIAAANELALDGEWLKISPYGDFPNKVGLQRVQKADAEAMVAAFNSLRGRASRLFMGLPIYVGHPDMEPQAYPDKRRYGKITDLEARPDGFYGKVAFNDLGKNVMDQGHFQFNSPSWFLKRDGKFVRPVELISVGLTNTPQIPGDPWAKNETTNETTMPKWLLDLLVAKGLMKPDDNEEKMQTAVNSLLALPARVTELETKLTSATNETTRLTGEVTRVTGELTTSNNKVTSLTTERDGLLTARNTRELDIAVNSGAIKEADRAAWNTKLTENFDTNVKELHGKKTAVNTQSQVAGLGQRKSEANASSQKITAINEAVSKYAKDHGLNIATNEGHNAAFAAVRKAQPALFS
jgi:hypothetical protein